MEASPADRASDLINGYRASQLVRAACELRIPDLTALEASSAEELAEATSVDTSRLRRLLRGLVALGVLVEVGSGRYRNSEVGETLRDGVPGSLRARALNLRAVHYRAWEHLGETLRTGRTGVSIAFGSDHWDQLRGDPEAAAHFNAAMASSSEVVAKFVAENCEFSNCSVIVDVGGGSGGLATGVLEAHPHLKGIVCDLPSGLTATSDYLSRHGVVDRCSIVEADFFDSIPEGGDVYLLKNIVHDWDDQKAARIIGTCRRAMRTGARIVLVERVLPAQATDSPAARSAFILDLHMMVLFGSRERTEAEYRQLLEAAGLRFMRSVPGERFGLIEAVAV